MRARLATAPRRGARLGARVAGLVIALALAAATSGNANAAGSYVIAEGQAGYSAGSVFSEGPEGFATKLTLGAGGKFVNWPVRFYGIINFTWAGYAGAVNTGLATADTSRDWVAVSGGLRMLAPIAHRLRFLTDVSIGTVSVDSEASLNGGREIVHDSDSAMLIEVGVGLQYRAHYHFSFGARADLAFPLNLDAFDLVGELSGLASGSGSALNPSALVTATLHL